MESNNQQLTSQTGSARDAEAIKHMEQAVADGKHWYIAMLEAIGLWSTAEETIDGRIYCYLIEGEAFDWLLLAERLCEAVDGLVPEDEKTSFLFRGKVPVSLTVEQFKELIGNSKYRQYLNYFYGVTVEEALIQAVKEEVRKEKRPLRNQKEQDTVDEAYRRIYGDNRAVLLRQFRREKGFPQLRSISLPELKEFIYWLFKYRLQKSDKAKVASDTKKALAQLGRRSVGAGFTAGIDPQLQKESAQEVGKQ